MGKGKQILLLVFLIFLLIVIDYSFIDTFLIGFFDESETGIVKRVIDGDTFVIGNESIRLLGINTPERGEYLYQEAKEFLNNSVLNKSVKLEFGKEKYDRYQRKLAYIFLDTENINLQLVKNGFANFYFPSGKDTYYKEFFDAWIECINKNINLCEKSKDKCADCIKLKELNVKEQKVILENKCDFDCSLKNWSLKDEGRKKFIFDDAKNLQANFGAIESKTAPTRRNGNDSVGFILNSGKEINIIVSNKTNNVDNIYWKDYDYIWTSTGDSLFLRDEEGKLVLWRTF